MKPLLTHRLQWPWLSLLRRPWLQNHRGIAVILTTGLTFTGLLLALRYWDGVQALELRVYDRLVRLRGSDHPDPRLLIVGITEADLQRLNRATPSDRALAEVLKNLQASQPTLIGLDLHRDVPQFPGHSDLAKQLQAENLIAITKLGDTLETAIPPPDEVPPERIGFNDFIIDPDGVIRRNLLFATGPDQQVTYSFSLQLALAYLARQNIQPRNSDRNPEHLALGAATFEPLTKHSGAYHNIDARGYQILLNYRTAHAIARQVSFSDLLIRPLPEDWVRDKIVLIGTVAPSGKDLFYTPYSAGEQLNHQMPGVMVHAQMLSQILDAALDTRPLLWFWPDWAEALWIGLWALIGGSLAWQVRHALVLSLVTTGAIALLLGASFIIFLHQGWIPSVIPMTALIATNATVVAYRAQRAQRQQQMVMTLLGQNTSPEIAQALWDNRDNLLHLGKLPGQAMTATLLFSDLKNFSTIAEQMSPEELLNWLNEYLSAMTDQVQAYQGIINKFTGDGLLAVFGVPVARSSTTEISQDAQQAVACALAMGDRLEQLNQTWQQRKLPKVQMRIGIYTGSIVAGSLGGKDRLEYGVIGDSVNIAARLENCEKERHTGVCRILIADQTLAYLHNRFRVEAWGPLFLKGRQQSVEVYQVLGHAEIDLTKP